MGKSPLHQCVLFPSLRRRGRWWLGSVQIVFLVRRETGADMCGGIDRPGCPPDHSHLAVCFARFFFGVCVWLSW